MSARMVSFDGLVSRVDCVTPSKQDKLQTHRDPDQDQALSQGE